MHAIPLRGHDNDENFNFMQLLKLCGEEDIQILEWLNQITDKYMSSDIQNEMLKVN